MSRSEQAERHFDLVGREPRPEDTPPRAVPLRPLEHGPRSDDSRSDDSSRLAAGSRPDDEARPDAEARPDDRAAGLLEVRRVERTSPALAFAQAGGWPLLCFFLLALLLTIVVLLGHQALRQIDTREQQEASAMARVMRKIQSLEAGIDFDSRRRLLLLAMRDHILATNPRASLDEAYAYSELALEASEKYPAIDPLLLVAIGSVESRYDPQARSPADARGLYQIWPSTGRMLVRALGWNYEEDTLFDPRKNTEAAALYLDVLFATYKDPQLVLAEYNGGPLNAGYFRASARALAPETREYVPRVLELYKRLREQVETGAVARGESSPGEARRRGRRLDADAQPTLPGKGDDAKAAARAAPVAG